jgi:drug/metabolite transporter (DMT)-like permease
VTTTARTESQGLELGAGTAYTLLAALGFAAVSTLTSIALGEHVSLFTILTWRYTLGSVVMVTYVATQRFPRMRWNESFKFIIIGGGGQALLVGLALSSLQYITAATLGFLFYTYPAWVTLVQAVRGAERVTLRRAIALALSFGGIAVIVGAPGATSLPVKGVALAIGAAMIYGVYIPIMRALQKEYPVTLTSAYGKIGSAICFLLLAATDQSFSYSLSGSAWGAIIALTLFSTVMPSIFFMMGLIRLGPVRTAIVSTIEPFLTAVLGAVVLKQALTLNTIAGGAMIVAAVVVLQMKRDRVA